MKCRKFLLTGLAVLGITLTTMAQNRDDRPDRQDGPGSERQDRPGQDRQDKFVKEVPRGGKEVVYKDVRYHYVEGKYYRPQKGGYEMVQPPVGMKVNNLPPGYTVKKHRGVTYYYKNDVCYKKGPNRNAYVIVKKPW